MRNKIRQELAHFDDELLACLAPLAGYSDLPYRSLCAREGSSLQTTELVSAAGIRHSGLQKSWRYLAIDPAVEGKVLIQLFGSEPDDYLFAVEEILAHPILQKCWGIDINMGCPVPKVVKSGAGSALMEAPEVAEAIVSRLAEVLQPLGYKMSVKLRRGFLEEETVPDLAVRLAEAGAQIITVHGRFRSQYYSGEADMSCIRRVHDKLLGSGLRDQVFLIANGDIVDRDSAVARIAYTQADGVAIGRAAEGNPWIFRPFRYPERGLASDEEKKSDIFSHAQALAEFLGEEVGMREFRKVLVRYSQGRAAARALRASANEIGALADVETWLAKF